MNPVQSDDTLNQDPDYFTAVDTDVDRQNVFENNARANTAKKIHQIIEAEFTKEINNKKSEIFQIYKSLNKACKMLHYLRFAIVTDFYNKENAYAEDAQVLKQTRLHPAIINSALENGSRTDIKNIGDINQKSDFSKKRKIDHEELSEPKKKCFQPNHTTGSLEKLSLGGTCKTKKRIIVGNISKWIPSELRENSASHKWTIYVRDSQKTDLGHFVSKVRFFLHPSYKPNDVVELISPPFHLSRHGWGEFPARVQLHFTNNLDKPIDIIHHLKLDRTFTGLQTIGSETIVDIWISTVKDISVQNLTENNFGNVALRQKNELYSHILKDHDYCSSKVLDEVTDIFPKELELSAINTQNTLFDEKIGCLRKKAVQNDKVWSGKNVKLVSLLKKPNNLPQNDLSRILNSNASENLTKNNKLEYLYNMQSSSSNCDINDIYDRNIYSKQTVDDRSADYKESSNRLVNLIDHSKPSTLFHLLKFIAQRMPLIMKKSVKSYYKMMHPYASENYQVFINSSLPKQQSLERKRAVCALNILEKTKNYDNICNTTEFIIWARRYGYTPFLHLNNIQKLRSNSSLENRLENEKYQCTSTVSNKLNKWLAHCQKCKVNAMNSSYQSDPIDILNDVSNVAGSKTGNQISKPNVNTLTILTYPEVQTDLNEYVCKSTQEIGIKLTNEEIVPGIVHNSANVLMSKAVECFMDELVRLAFSCAIDRCNNQSDAISINSNDVRMALLKREEFDIFTNHGLGSDG